MNKQKGNMYPFVSHTHNPIRGKCEHDCSYCYMKVFPQKELRLSEKSLKERLGQDNYIFIGSSTDMFANNVPKEWILKVLHKCKLYNNVYLFQTKNPERFKEFLKEFPPKTILGTTLETNRESPSKAPSTYERYSAFLKIKGFRKMVSIEPIIDFDLETMVDWLKRIKPEFVSIGADSKNHGLLEPSAEKIESLIKILKEITKVKIKDNLKRIISKQQNET